jgi:tetratricopeptide (TPR) repeat protein
MKLQLLILSFFLLLAISSSQADKKDKLIVNTRFNRDAAVYVNRGTDLMEKGDIAGARSNYEAAIRSDPSIWPAYLNLAGILAREGQWEAALKNCNLAMRLRPGFFRTSILRANVNLHLGRDRDSLADLDHVLSLHADDGTDAVALSQRAWLRVVSADPAVYNPKAGLADAHEACRLNYWKKASYIEALATACAANGDYDSALRYEKQAIDSGRLSEEELKEASSRLARYGRHQPAPRSSH